jgi:hypothetical protein
LHWNGSPMFAEQDMRLLGPAGAAYFLADAAPICLVGSRASGIIASRTC